MEHYWHLLPGPSWFGSARIYAEQVRRANEGAVFVEVGAWKGRSASFMGVEIANSGKSIAFYTVDNWRGSPEHIEDEDVRLGRLYEVFLNNIEPVKDYVRPLRADSAEAAMRFGDRSVDFVYLDAEHSAAAVAREITAWWPKLKVGGTLAGDDWSFVDPSNNDFGVRRAVIDFFEPRGIDISIQAGSPNEWEQWLVRKQSLASKARAALRSMLAASYATFLRRS